MKKLFLVAPVCATLVFASVAAHAENISGRFFVSGAMGSSHSNVSGLDDKNDLGYTVGTGYRWMDRWGIEASYVDLGTGAAKFGYGRDTYKVTLSTSGWTLGANGKFDFAKDWYVGTRLGVFFANTEARASGVGKASSDDVGGYAGVGLGYNITTHLGVSVNFDRYWAKADGIVDGTNAPYLLSAKVEYRF